MPYARFTEDIDVLALLDDLKALEKVLTRRGSKMDWADMETLRKGDAEET